MKPVDSLIFDMDGTLWDAVDSYVKVWDATFEAFGLSSTVDRENLITCMGLPINEIYARLVGDDSIREKYLKLLDDNENSMMLTLGGRLYPGVRETIPELAKSRRLFMVSNCGAQGLPNFLRFTGLGPYFTDTASHGSTGLGKADNIRMLITRYGLESPVYVGDTAGDCTAAHAAGIPMIHAAYGFGTAPDADCEMTAFDQLPDILDNISRQ